MIKDVDVLHGIQDEWETVRKTWEMASANIVWSFVSGGHVSQEFSSVAYSLTLLFSFTVLEHVLQQLRDERRFACKSNFIGNLMTASKNSLPWIDFALIDEARERRNDIAHRQQWIEIDDCKKYIDAIESELRGWNILSIASSDKSP